MDDEKSASPPSYQDAVRSSLDSEDDPKHSQSTETFPDEKANSKDATVREKELQPTDKPATVPSHSPLAFANYPPLWTKDAKPKHTRQPSSSASASSSKPPPKERTQSGFSAATLSSVMSPGSKDPKAKRFEDSDADNRHRYSHKPENARHGLHLFGRDIGGLSSKPPGLNFKRQKGK